MELLRAFEAHDRDQTPSRLREAVDPRDSRHLLLKKIYEAHCLLDIRFDADAVSTATFFDGELACGGRV